MFKMINFKPLFKQVLFKAKVCESTISFPFQTNYICNTKFIVLLNTFLYTINLFLVIFKFSDIYIYIIYNLSYRVKKKQLGLEILVSLLVNQLYISHLKTFNRK